MMIRKLGLTLILCGSCSAFLPTSHRHIGTAGVECPQSADFKIPSCRKFSKPLPRVSSLTTRNAIPASIQTGFQSAGVQKVLELGVVAFVGAMLRDKLDAKAVTALLLNALVPAVIVSSLSTLTLSSEMGVVVLSGLALVLVQIVSGELAARFVFPNATDDEAEASRRTAAVQLGTMAPALSVFSFTREFVGASFAGLAALADLPNKVYSLLLLPYYLRFKSAPSSDSDAMQNDNTKPKTSLGKKISGILSDPFNLAIFSGLLLASIGKPVASLGFVGKAIGGLVQTQTSILFLLIGLKLKFGGDRPKLCLQLLLARHGFCSLAVSAFLALFMKNADSASHLAVVLSSNAASSIIAFGQMNKAVGNGAKGYDTNLAFDIVALSFPFTVMLNTVASLAGASYTNFLPVLGTAFLALSAIVGKCS